ncbi:hypothetical protein L3X38_010379 [Prunus dulcis]|uniref:Uncharacterized protein n=1 Tax=Prunus dulcis TaxID=3755 RepID=A0AAD4ZE45_PRUDU|nr:hypothetical protein L3X38_010379 [Prunus dulcis]
MMRQYEMIDLGLLHHFLGLGVLQIDTCIFLHHKKYAKTLLEKFGLKDCKSVATPLAVNEKLSKVDESDLAYETLGVSWASIKQSSVALSTAQAEYISATEATAQAIWLRFVLSNFGEEQAEPTQLLCDNTSAIATSKNPVHHHKTRHINRRFHFIRDALQDGEIDLLYCKTEEQVADIFTKALARDHFEFLKKAHT